MNYSLSKKAQSNYLAGDKTKVFSSDEFVSRWKQ